MSLHPIFEWADGTALGTAIRNSYILFPAVETTHLIGLALLLGSILIANARFFGIGLRRQTIFEVVQDFAPWTLVSLGLMAVSGSLMFLAQAKEIYEHKGWRFLTKVTLLVLAVTFHFTVYRRIAPSGRAKWVAGVSLLLWFATACAGLALQFL